jgi:hypothetical protein
MSLSKLIIAISLLLVSFVTCAVTVTPTGPNLVLAGDVSTDKIITFTVKVATAGKYILDISELPGTKAPCSTSWTVSTTCLINTDFHVISMYDGATLIYDNRFPIPKVVGGIFIMYPLSVGTHKITVHSSVAIVPANQRIVPISYYFGYSSYNFSVAGPL